MFETVVLGILSSLLAKLLIDLARFRDFFWPQLMCRTIYRNKLLRVSMAAIVRLSDGSGYLLIKNQRRPEFFGPIGGVIKFYTLARLEDRFEFQSQSKRSDLKNDLRGFLPGRNFYKFMQWFRSKQDREVESVTRELIEELQEIGLDNVAANIQALPLSFVRYVHEGVRPVTNTNYYQFRYLEIYELDPTDENGRMLTQQLFAAAQENSDLLVVTQQEIDRGRAKTGEPIGIHSNYLIREKRVGSEPAPFYE